MAHRIVDIVDDQPTFEVPLQQIWDECVAGGAIKVLTPQEYITHRQLRWWKGVLLPQLAEETGESVSIWENRLKLAVLPEDFKPEYINIDGMPIATVPSITKLGKRKMNKLIEGAVQQCHSWNFTWVTLPDSELRRL